ncbi:hypothetical protein [Frankia sp. Cj5]|uniref:hypothetical protein n=1 Tax=Frankia sp. Cj5 TaxID=2880978 RepID=UPI001EF62203|nr:hypothetical protein [Frankia sp. Cj5]
MNIPNHEYVAGLNGGFSEPTSVFRLFFGGPLHGIHSIRDERPAGGHGTDCRADVPAVLASPRLIVTGPFFQESGPPAERGIQK